MGFPPWTPDSPFFLSPYHIPVIPVSSSLTVAICFYLEWLSKWPQSVQKSKGQRKSFLGAAVKTNSYMMPQALLTDTAIAPLSWCSESLGRRWKTAAHSSAPSQQPGALLGKLPHPPALGLHTSLTSSKIHSPSSTSTPDNDNICFGPEHPGLLTPIFPLSLWSFAIFYLLQQLDVQV